MINPFSSLLKYSLRLLFIPFWKQGNFTVTRPWEITMRQLTLDLACVKLLFYLLSMLFSRTRCKCFIHFVWHMNLNCIEMILCKERTTHTEKCKKMGCCQHAQGDKVFFLYIKNISNIYLVLFNIVSRRVSCTSVKRWLDGMMLGLYKRTPYCRMKNYLIFIPFSSFLF